MLKKIRDRWDSLSQIAESLYLIDNGFVIIDYGFVITDYEFDNRLRIRYNRLRILAKNKFEILITRNFDKVLKIS